MQESYWEDYWYLFWISSSDCQIWAKTIIWAAGNDSGISDDYWYIGGFEK